MTFYPPQYPDQQAGVLLRAPRRRWPGALVPAAGYARCYECRLPWWLLDRRGVSMRAVDYLRTDGGQVLSMGVLCASCWLALDRDGRLQAYAWHVFTKLPSDEAIDIWPDVFAAVVAAEDDDEIMRGMADILAGQPVTEVFECAIRGYDGDRARSWTKSMDMQAEALAFVARTYPHAHVFPLSTGGLMVALLDRRVRAAEDVGLDEWP